MIDGDRSALRRELPHTYLQRVGYVTGRARFWAGAGDGLGRSRKFSPMDFANIFRPFRRPVSVFFRHRHHFRLVFDRVATKTCSCSGNPFDHIRKAHRRKFSRPPHAWQADIVAGNPAAPVERVATDRWGGPSSWPQGHRIAELHGIWRRMHPLSAVPCAAS